MRRQTIGRIATVSAVLGTATIACTPSSQVGHVAALSARPHKADTAAASRAADTARAALAKRDAGTAVLFAERAVAFSPNDADHRMLLGQAYLSAGRFASADSAFRDTLSLSPDRPRASLDLVLAQVAEGKPDAKASVAALKGRIADSDLGLAQALAGDEQGAIATLTDIVRSGKSDARSRQNLALAFALSNRWDEARGMAMQDTGPDRIDDQLGRWAMLAKSGSPAVRVAALLDTVPAAVDPGQPTRLALAAPSASAPVAVALTAPEAPAAPLAAAPPPAEKVTLPLEAPAAVAMTSDLSAPAVPAPATLAEIAAAAPAPVAAPPAVVPVMLAAVPASTTPAALTPPRLVRAAMPAAKPAMRRSVAPGPVYRMTQTGGYVVQLGAFSRAQTLETAWTQVSKMTPKLATFTPVKGSIQRQGVALVRLSVGNFADRGEAQALCTQIKARGGACFVRATAGDARWEWAAAKSPVKTQLAMN